MLYGISLVETIISIKFCCNFKYATQWQRQRQQCTVTATANGNGETATEWWKPGISLPYINVTDRQTDGRTDGRRLTIAIPRYSCTKSNAPLIRSRPWRYINLLTYLLTYLRKRTLKTLGLFSLSYTVKQ